MTKKQKVWLGIFLAMFVVPEVFWGPLLGAFNFILNSHLRSIIQHSEIVNSNNFVAVLIIVLEIIGLSGIIMTMKMGLKEKKFSFYLITFLGSLFILFLMFTLYISLSLNNMFT